MSADSSLPVAPPTGYLTWLDYAVATLDTRSVSLDLLFDADTGGAKVPTREAMQLTAEAELRALRQAAGVPDTYQKEVPDGFSPSLR